MSDNAAIELAGDGWTMYRAPAMIRHENAAEVRQHLLDLIDSGASRLRMDMVELQSVDSTGLTLVMSFLATLSQERPAAEVAFVGLSAQILRVMGMVRAKDFGLQVTITGAPR